MRIKTRERGATLIEVLFLIGAMSAATVLSMESRDTDHKNIQARSAGGLLLQYNSAVREWVAKNSGASGTYNGTSWLKLSSCGGLSTVEYLPCEFPQLSTAVPLSQGNLAVSTTVSTSGVAPNEITRAVSTLSPYTVNGKIRSDLAGISALVIASGSEIIGDSNVTASPVTGVIQLEASTDGSLDGWLRVDGGNTMKQAITFDNPAGTDRTIIGVSIIDNLAGQLLFLGRSSGVSPVIGSGVVIDSDSEIIGKLTAQGDITARRQINVTSGDVDIQSGNLVAKGLADVTDSALIIDPDATSTVKGLDIAGNFISNARFTPGLQLDMSCSVAGAVSTDSEGKVISCKNGSWIRVSKSPTITRYTFTANSTFTVPDGVISAYISMAGGGGSGLGWRSVSYTRTGHSGGYVMNHPLNLIPGEVLDITIGKGGAGYAAGTTGRTSERGAPFYIYYNNNADIYDGLSGYPGTSTIVTSLTRGELLIECTGGSGADMNGFNAYQTSKTVPTHIGISN
jgi:hypothetical protein